MDIINKIDNVLNEAKKVSEDQVLKHSDKIFKFFKKGDYREDDPQEKVMALFDYAEKMKWDISHLDTERLAMMTI